MSALPTIRTAARRARTRSLAASVILPWAPLAALLSLAVGYVHLAYVDSHWEDWWAYGAFFLVTGIGQLAFAPLVLLWPKRWLLLVGMAGNLAIVGMYIMSRTQGIPMGPHTGVKESVAFADLATTGAEIALAAVLLIMIGGRLRTWTINLLLVSGIALWALRLSDGLV